MRVLIVSHAAIRSSNRRVYRALAKRGSDVTVLVPHRWESGLGSLRAESEPVNSGVNVVVRRRYGIAHSNVYWLAGLDRSVRETSPQAVYVDEDPAGFAAAQSAFSAHRHGAGLVVLGIQNLFKRYPPPFERLQRFVFEHTSTAVCTSGKAAETLTRRGFRGTMLRMPFSTDLAPLDERQRERIRSELALRGPVIGYSGRLVHEKGVDVFIRAIAQLPNVKGAIIGDGPQRAELERLASDLGTRSRIHFLGIQPPSRAAALVGCLDVLALPSRTMRNWSEQFGRVLIEAMASGVPVVASNSGAIPEVIGEAGLLVPEDDPEALAAALRRALDEHERLRRLGLDRICSRFTDDAEAGALDEALHAAARRAKAG